MSAFTSSLTAIARLAAVLVLIAPMAAARVDGPVEAAFREALLGELGDGSESAEIRITGLTWSDPKLGRNANKLVAFELMPAGRAAGRYTARVDVSSAGRVQTTFVLADVDVLIPVWVTTGRIPHGAPLAGQVALESRSLKALPAQVLRDTDVLDQRVAARSLPAGTVLTSLSAVPPLVVARGDSVSIAVSVGNVVVKARGQALEAGRLGQSIRVTGPSRATIEARVAGPGQVEVMR
ncbi:MAG: flagellar basal body P-ring formation protein FlgA [Myxococcales bacterium]|nr:flagellar basal body P-ring formation protein FlgA [Myxococcales bacterium]